MARAEYIGRLMTEPPKGYDYHAAKLSTCHYSFEVLKTLFFPITGFSLQVLPEQTITL